MAVSAAYSAKIYKQYGDQSIEIVQRNPYRLAHGQYTGLAFITADKIAQNLGIDRNSLDPGQSRSHLYPESA